MKANTALLLLACGFATSCLIWSYALSYNAENIKCPSNAISSIYNEETKELTCIYKDISNYGLKPLRKEKKRIAI